MLLKIKQVINNEVIITGTKELYSVSYLCSEWVREEIVKKDKNVECVVLTNYITVKNRTLNKNPKMVKNGLGFFHNNSNAVYHNGQFVGIYSSPIDTGGGLPFSLINFRKVVALFAARKTIKGNWINDNDEYLTPCY